MVHHLKHGLAISIHVVLEVGDCSLVQEVIIHATCDVSHQVTRNSRSHFSEPMAPAARTPAQLTCEKDGMKFSGSAKLIANSLLSACECCLSFSV